MNILITGCLGHIGSFLVSKLDKFKNVKKVYLIDNNANNKLNTIFNLKTKKKIIFFNENLANSEVIYKIKNISTVIHLASITNAEASLGEKKKYFKNNIGCLKNVVKFCILRGANLLHISSTSVYGDQSKFVNEDSKYIKPQSPYAKIKLLEEKILKKNKKLRFITLRFGTICGPSKGMRFHTAVNKFCYQTIMGENLTIWNTAMNQYRPYLSLNDALKTINFIINNNIFDNDTYNVLSNNLTVNQILKYIKDCGYKIKIKKISSKIMNQLSYKVDKSKFEKLGIKLNYNVKKEIKETLKTLSVIKNAK